VNKIELPIEEAIRLYQNASVGKLVGGLVHNMNGPLHTLGIEMDVIGLLLRKNPDLDPEFVQGLSKRLNRMGEEFDRLNTLIRLTADRAELSSQYSPAYIDLNHVLQEEVEFLSANLYFKHQVETYLDLDPQLQTLRPKEANLLLGVRWFVQGLVEEIETSEIRSLLIKTTTKQNRPTVLFQIKDGSLTEGFLQMLDHEPVSLLLTSAEFNNIGMCLALTLLKSSGVSLTLSTAPSLTEIYLSFPHS